MKPFHIVFLVFIIAAIGVVISLFANTSTYSDFATAASNPSKEYHVIGKLQKDKPIEYNSSLDANSFSFFMVDEKNLACQVVYKGAKPQDFEKSEQVVIIGKMQDSVFVARNLLLKCPSKYNEENKPQSFDTQTF